MPITTRSDPSDHATTPEGFKVPARFSVEVKDDRTAEYDIELTARLVDGRYVAEGLTVTKKQRGPEVTGEGLRKVKVAALLYLGAVKETAGAVPPTWELRRLRAGGPTDETLELVARVYRIAFMCRYPPTQDVAYSFGVPRPTAARWVGLARERGFLRKAEPGRAGERKRKGKS
jgi:hypothetical protein